MGRSRIGVASAFLAPGVGRVLDGVEHVLLAYTSSPEFPLRVTSDVSPRLFVLGRNDVRISTWQSEGIAAYSGITIKTYLMVCGALGLLQWRTLGANPVLIEEDFTHPPSDCILSSRASKPEYALLFDTPSLCAGCAGFYRRLGVLDEVMAVETLLAAIRDRQASLRALSPT